MSHALVPLARAVGLSALAVLTGAVVASALLVDGSARSRASATGATVVAVAGTSPLAGLGVRSGDVIECARVEDARVVITLVREGHRLSLQAQGAQNVVLGALLQRQLAPLVDHPNKECEQR